MSWWNAKYTNGNGDNEITFGSKYYERAKAVEKVCQAVVDKKVKTPDDVAVVVHCKDCKHFKSYGTTSLRIDGKNIKAGWCHRRARYDEEYRMPPDGFCSYGERKDGGADDADQR